jgi:hypothetical protein
MEQVYGSNFDACCLQLGAGGIGKADPREEAALRMLHVEGTPLGTGCNGIVFPVKCNHPEAPFPGKEYALKVKKPCLSHVWLGLAFQTRILQLHPTACTEAWPLL